MQSLEEIEKEEQRVQDFYVKQYEEGKLISSLPIIKVS